MATTQPLKRPPGTTPQQEQKQGEEQIQVQKQKRQRKWEWPVFLYVPNLIGYLRIILCIHAVRNYSNPHLFLLYYMSGFLLDGADGLAARVLNQTSRAGAVLDMLTDRCGTAALLALLARTDHWVAAPLCTVLVFLDGYSHWMQMVAGGVAGKSSHKAASRGTLLNLYYWRPVLTVVCLFSEVTLVAVYMAVSGYMGPILFDDVYGTAIMVVHVVLVVCAPVCALKQLVSLIQIFSAHETIVDSLT